MKVHRSYPESRFTIIPDQTLRDDRLSYLARGVLGELLSRPDDWQTTVDSLWRHGKHERGPAAEGRKVIRAAFTELEACGYLRRVRRRTITGRIATDLHIYDVPAGHTDSHPGGCRPRPGETGTSPQVAPTTSPPTVGEPAVGEPTATRVAVFTETEDGDGFKGNGQNGNGSLSSVERAAQRLVECGGTEREIRFIIDEIGNDPKIGRPGPYLRTAIERGDAPVLLAKARQALARDDAMANMPASNGSGHPAWCGQCHQSTRMRENDDGRPYHCPDCHPLRATS